MRSTGTSYVRSTDTRLFDPDAGLDVPAVLGHQVEVGSRHRGLNRRGLAEQARVDRQVAVSGEGCDRLVKDGGTGVEVEVRQPTSTPNRTSPATC